MADTPVKIYHVEDTEATLIANLDPFQWGLATDTDNIILQHGYDSGYSTIRSDALPAGSDTEIQFNDGGTVLGADPGLTFITASKSLVITDSGGDSLTIVGEQITASRTLTLEAAGASGYISIEAAQTCYLQGLVGIDVYSNSYATMETTNAHIKLSESATGTANITADDSIDLTTVALSMTADTIQLYANDAGGARVGAFEIHSGYVATDTLMSADTDATDHWDNLQLFSDIPVGFTPEFRISGYRTADALRTGVFTVDPDANDTFRFHGVTNFRYYNTDVLIHDSTWNNTLEIKRDTVAGGFEIECEGDLDIDLTTSGDLKLQTAYDHIIINSADEVQITSVNGTTITTLTAERLVMTDASNYLISDTSGITSAELATLSLSLIHI